MQAIAAFSRRTKPELIEVPRPESPAAGEVLCRTLELGVCGTDREILLSAAPLVPEGSEYLVLGHECLGRVEAVGPGGDELKVGELVVPVVRRPDHTAGMNPATRSRVDLWPFGTYVERGIVREHGFSAPLWPGGREHHFVAAGTFEDQVESVALDICRLQRAVGGRIRASWRRWSPPASGSRIRCGITSTGSRKESRRSWSIHSRPSPI